jgi:hypothetical protein
LKQLQYVYDLKERCLVNISRPYCELLYYCTSCKYLLYFATYVNHWLQMKCKCIWECFFTRILFSIFKSTQIILAERKWPDIGIRHQERDRQWQKNINFEIIIWNQADKINVKKNVYFTYQCWNLVSLFLIKLKSDHVENEPQLYAGDDAATQTTIFFSYDFSNLYVCK